MAEPGALQHYMVETFIYFHWVGQDTKDTRARLVFAAGCHRKTVFFNENPGYARQADDETWGAGLRTLAAGLEGEWEK